MSRRRSNVPIPTPDPPGLAALEQRLRHLEADVRWLKGVVRPLAPPERPLTPDEWCLLRALSRHGRCTVSALAAGCHGPRGGHDRRAVGRRLTRLKACGLADHDKPGRGRQWFITTTGVHFLGHYDPERRARRPQPTRAQTESK